MVTGVVAHYCRDWLCVDHGRPMADRLIYDGLTMATTVAFRRIMVDAIVDRNSRDPCAGDRWLIALATMHGRYVGRSPIALFNHDVPSISAGVFARRAPEGAPGHQYHQITWPSVSSDHLAAAMLVKPFLRLVPRDRSNRVFQVLLGRNLDHLLGGRVDPPVGVTAPLRGLLPHRERDEVGDDECSCRAHLFACDHA